MARRRESVTKILDAADPKTRRSVLSKLSTRGVVIAEPNAPFARANEPSPSKYRSAAYRVTSTRAAKDIFAAAVPPQATQPAATRPELQLRIEFDQLIHLDSTALSAVLREVDADVLRLHS